MWGTTCEGMAYTLGVPRGRRGMEYPENKRTRHGGMEILADVLTNKK